MFRSPCVLFDCKEVEIDSLPSTQSPSLSTRFLPILGSSSRPHFDKDALNELLRVPKDVTTTEESFETSLFTEGPIPEQLSRSDFMVVPAETSEENKPLSTDAPHVDDSPSKTPTEPPVDVKQIQPTVDDAIGSLTTTLEMVQKIKELQSFVSEILEKQNKGDSTKGTNFVCFKVEIFVG